MFCPSFSCTVGRVKNLLLARTFLRCQNCFWLHQNFWCFFLPRFLFVCQECIFSMYDDVFLAQKAGIPPSRKERRLAAFYTRCLRRMLGVSWQDHVPNEEMRELAKYHLLTSCDTNDLHGTTRVPSPKKRTHALERCSVERPTRLWTLLRWGNSQLRTARGGDHLCWRYVGLAQGSSSSSGMMTSLSSLVVSSKIRK